MPTRNRPPSLPVRLDVENEWVWLGEQKLRLTPKAFAVLRYLMERSERLVSKDELLRAVWADSVVSEWALTSCLREIRKTLRDKAKAPRFIETVHRRGYRFIAPLTVTQSVVSSQYPVTSRKPLENSPSQLTTRLVGREAELAYLHERLEKVRRGERQVVFVTGEPGIGKTTLVDAFLERGREKDKLWTGQGQCIEHFGTGEPYLPVLEALGQLCRQSRNERLIESLKRYAPTWLMQLPWLLSPSEQEGVQRQVAGATRERMLREMAELVEALTTEMPLILVLEDLQWSDYSTLDLLSFLARRERKAARLLVIGTYRPVDVLVRDHPLKGVKQELLLHGQCAELPLEMLAEKMVTQYLEERFLVGTHGQGRSQTETIPLQKLARIVHRRTDGNPLFMVTLVDYLVAQGVIDQNEPLRSLMAGQQDLPERVESLIVGVPESVRQMVEVQLGSLHPEERRVLEAASVGGVEFSAPTVAAALQEGTIRVEECCEGLMRRGQFLRPAGVGEWPDGTVTASYRFLHALYQEMLYEHVTATRRMELHRRIGERQESGYGGRAGEIAVALAVHFEAGREYGRAVQYLRQAAENALRRSAHQEASNHLTKALELLKTLPSTLERSQQELRLNVALGVSLSTLKGYGAPDVGQAFTRARELCQQQDDTPQLFPVLTGLFGFYLLRVELQTARELAERLLNLAQRQDEPALLIEAHHALGAVLFHLGEFASAREHSEQVRALYDLQQHGSLALLYFGHDPGVLSLCYETLILWHLGYPDQAVKRHREALALAQQSAHLYSQAVALDMGAWIHQYRREGQAVQEWAEAALALSHEHGFAQALAFGPISQGWALTEQERGDEGITLMRQGLAACEVAGAELIRSYFLGLLADGYEKAGQPEEGLSVLAEALAVVQKGGERWYEAELYRLKGELLLSLRERGSERMEEQILHSLPHPFPLSSPEECFHKSIEIACKQGAKSLELRAVTSLARLWQQQGKTAEARPMLAEIYGWFTEGFDTKDLQEAKVLLAALLP
jgi:DNA-binding winged helix-turn-helix (wHTH) protein/predicted ATPase